MNQPDKLLDRSVRGIARAFHDGTLNKVVAIVGAGISTASGIPDFRSENGLYSILRQRGFARPEDVFTWKWFNANRQTYYEIMQKVMPSEANPTTAHAFLKWLDQRGSLVRLYTQNIDGLELKAGISPNKVVQLHGSNRRFECDKCKDIKTSEQLTSAVPTCTRCGTVMRPDIVFFGEQTRMGTGQLKDFTDCDALLVMGTSLTVWPCASFVNNVSLKVPRILINDREIEWPVDFRRVWNKFDFVGQPVRDVMLKGDVQDICREILTGQ